MNRVALSDAPSRPVFPVLPAQDSAEWALLLACLRSRFDPAATETVAAAARAGVDPTRLAEIARRHRVGGLVMRRLRTAGVADLEAASEVATAAETAGVRGLRMASGLARVLDLFGEAGIRPLALKGPIMAAELYGDVGARPSGDLDLLVRADDQTQARHTLVKAGFRADPPLDEQGALDYLAAGFAYSFRDDAQDLIVEVHPSLAHRDFRFEPDMEQLWDRAIPARIAGRTVLTLSPEDRFLFLCVHGAKHEWDQLIWVCDVAEAIRSGDVLDWTIIARQAVETGSLRMLQLGVHLANAFTGVTLPLEAAVLASRPGMDHLARQVWGRMLDPIERKPTLWRQLRFHRGVRERAAERWGQTREKVSDRIRTFARSARLMVAPSDTDRSFVELPDSLSALYYLVRPVRVLVGSRRRADAEAVPREGARSMGFDGEPGAE